MYDVAIVGAGPAGASTALHLLRERPGARTVLIDRARFPREKPCGGAISRWGLEALAVVDASLERLGVEHVPIGAVRVRHRDRVVESTTRRALGAVIRRDVFDTALAREAERRGAELVEGARVVAFERREGAWRIAIEDGREIAARFLVGADGTGSAVRRLVFRDEGARARLIVAESDAVPGDDVNVRGVIEFDLSPVDGGVDGYVWHFATIIGGAPKVSRGIFDWRGRRPGDAIALRRALEDALNRRGVEATKVRLKPYSARVFAGGSAKSSVHPDGAILAGEAAGLVDPITGEGIAQAIVSGRAVARSLARALLGGAIDAEAHRAALEALDLHRHLRRSAALAAHVYGSRAPTWAAALAGSSSAVDAGADWYAGARLGAWRKAKAALGLALAGVTSSTLWASRS